MPSFGKTLVLFLLFIVIIVFSLIPQSAPIRADLDVQRVLGALGGLLIIVLLVERVTEIVIVVWRDPDADAIKSRIETLSREPGSAAELAARIEQLVAYKSETKSRALLIGFTMAVIVCAAGVGVLQTVLDTSEANKSFLRGVDIVLTAGLIAGGSEAFHHVFTALETFFTQSTKRMREKP